ncbi:MAG: hypothetical protein SOV63_04645 [Pyramidobacter porci]|uniref:hypothetical protein n=1 Tax=Pyramidobacter porci TaxID=2605789 RepID=UPI002A755354|nr:hypothetical protein [Pyramidobacter porci]MDY2648075.1 hypothetical protein [Pyramidobacter porci]
MKKYVCLCLLWLASAAPLAAVPAPLERLRVAFAPGAGNLSVLAAAPESLWRDHLGLPVEKVFCAGEEEQLTALAEGRVHIVASIRASKVLAAAARGQALRIVTVACRPRPGLAGHAAEDDELVSVTTGQFIMDHNDAVRAFMDAQADAAEWLERDGGAAALLARAAGLDAAQGEELRRGRSFSPQLTDKDFDALTRTQARQRALGLAGPQALRSLIYYRQLRLLTPS